jgi:fatty acid desaturase
VVEKGSGSSSERAPSNDIPFALKATLVDEEGVRYRDFRASLETRWAVVWMHVALGYGALAALVALLAVFADISAAGIAVAVAGGLAIGYTLEFLSNFFHEAAHYNVAPGRARNDRVANVLIAWMFGRSIQAYRRIHFQHHRALGTTMDSENSYFDGLGAGYLAAGLFGLKAVRTMRRYREVEREQAARDGGPEQGPVSRLGWMAVAAGIDLGVAALLLVVGSPIAAIAWLWGVLFVFPFFGSLRQLLEHRSEDADSRVDYRKVDHGATNRLFGDGPLASTLGSAGFNRHALHHWEPTVSYTRLRDIQRYLEGTDLAPAIRERRTTYADTFLRLLEL